MPSEQDILDKKKFWEEELMQANKDRLFACSIAPLDPSRVEDPNATLHGLIGNHAYSIIRAVECKGQRFLVVRNPWGDSEWNGKWSDGSKEWTTEWLDALRELNHTFGEDGQFVMECANEVFFSSSACLLMICR
jgi:Calpain family cysteine protease